MAPASALRPPRRSAAASRLARPLLPERPRSLCLRCRYRAVFHFTTGRRRGADLRCPGCPLQGLRRGALPPRCPCGWGIVGSGMACGVYGLRGRLKPLFAALLRVVRKFHLAYGRLPRRTTRAPSPGITEVISRMAPLYNHATSCDFLNRTDFLYLNGTRSLQEGAPP